VSAVIFSAENSIEISVKNSGHNYYGASQKKDTLLINTKSLPKYSGASIEDCSARDYSAQKIDKSLINQPCKLAVARNRVGTIRVGGGENFNDVYLAVKEKNEMALIETGSYKYHFLGGGDASVTPMGWTWQGGLGGTTMGRTFGFGVDQVLQLEMILPDGSHVRFGPTEWESAEEYLYPKTTQVSGVCNQNPFDEDEANWKWEPCTNGVNFEDLWFATRGGGGGTWGVVLAVHLQLHEYPGLFQLVKLPDSMRSTIAGCNATTLKCEKYRSELDAVGQEFKFDFYVDPVGKVTGMTLVQANKCGTPSEHLNYCYGGGGDAFFAAWETRLEEEKSQLLSSGVPEEMLEIAGTDTTLDIYDDFISKNLYPEGHRHFGKGGADSPVIEHKMGSGPNPLIPKTVVLQNRDFWLKMYKKQVDLSYRKEGGWSDSYIAHIDGTDDQLSSLSEPHRTAAFMWQIIRTDITLNDIEEIYQMLFGGMDFEKDEFPGFLGSNHLMPHAVGPLKSNWTKPCPNDWTLERRADECFSPQVAVYGTKRLRHLEQIKADVDPNNLFNCAGCIGLPVQSTAKSSKKVKKDEKTNKASKTSKKGTHKAGKHSSKYAKKIGKRA